MSQKYAELWAELESRLTALVDRLAEQLASVDEDLLRDFIENREYGVAAELIADLAEAKQLDVEFREELAAIQERMR